MSAATTKVESKPLVSYPLSRSDGILIATVTDPTVTVKIRNVSSSMSFAFFVCSFSTLAAPSRSIVLVRGEGLVFAYLFVDSINNWKHFEYFRSGPQHNYFRSNVASELKSLETPGLEGYTDVQNKPALLRLLAYIL